MQKVVLRSQHGGGKSVRLLMVLAISVHADGTKHSVSILEVISQSGLQGRDLGRHVTGVVKVCIVSHHDCDGLLNRERDREPRKEKQEKGNERSNWDNSCFIFRGVRCL